MAKKDKFKQYRKIHGGICWKKISEADFIKLKRVELTNGIDAKDFAYLTKAKWINVTEIIFDNFISI